jgi:protein ImuB
MYHHRIPCYGDLTPGIPGVLETKAATHLSAGLLDNSRFPTPDSTRFTGSGGSPPVEDSALRSWELGIGNVFACLRGQPREALLPVARDFSPRVMTASDCEVLVDISGLGRLIGPPDEIARQLAQALFDAGLTASVAIGPTQTIARVLAHAGTGQGSWAQLPIHMLQPLEAGRTARATAAMNERDRARPYETFERWGIVTLGDLAALPASDLSSRLGRRGVALQRLARGLDLRPFVPDRDTRRFVDRLELEWPIDSLEPLSFVLARLLDPLSAALERADRGAVAIRLELRLTDRSTCTRVLPLPVPMRDPRVLRTLLMLALESHPPPAAIDIVSIELDPAPARIVRFSLLDRALPSLETIATLTARLSALVGESRVGSAALLDSHQPGAIEMRRFNPEIGDVKAAVAYPLVPTPALRRQRVPPAIRVTVERGRPVHIASSKRGMPCGHITEAAGPWRSSGGWWTDGKAEGQGPWNRNEWDVAVKSGAVCRIYQDRTTDRWFLEGVYD